MKQYPSNEDIETWRAWYHHGKTVTRVVCDFDQICDAAQEAPKLKEALRVALGESHSMTLPEVRALLNA